MKISFVNICYLIYLLAGFMFLLDLVLRRLLDVNIPLYQGWSALIIISLSLFILAILMMTFYRLNKKRMRGK
jgi:uncharacterized membrane protein YhaH (DUF805 family)